MSKIFYDHIVEMGDIDKHIKRHFKTADERAEIYQLIDEILHHKVLGCVLDKLPRHHHKEFIEKFSDKPHDNSLLLYLRERIADDIEHFIRTETIELGREILDILESREAKRTSKTT